MNKDTAIRYLVDAQGKAQGVFLEEEMWQRVCSHVLAELEKLFPSETGPAEPLADLALLEKYWDFCYDLPTDVACDICGASSPDWQADEPRKFILRAANMGGLLSFQCVSCKARVTKRHFKETLAVLLAWLYALAADADRGGAGGISGAVEGGDAEGGASEGVAGAGAARRVARRLHLVVDRRVVVDDAHIIILQKLLSLYL